jgi:intracellular sulfur oxidation DsrE/DsrF family protein
MVLGSDSLGHGDHELGVVHLENLLRAFAFRDDIPDVVVCYNSGATLVGEDSPVLHVLEVFAEKGVDILVCRTAVGHYKLDGKLVVGRPVDMHEVADVLSRASHVIYM